MSLPCQVESSIRRLKDFSGKLEENVEKWSIAVEVKDIDPQEKNKLTDVSEKLFIFMSEATTYDSGEKFTGENSYSEISTSEGTTDSRLDQIVLLQERMQEEMVRFQEMQLHQSQQQVYPQGSYSVSLPKLELPSYNGDKIRFKEFWDSFDATINRNSKLSRIEKFNYLRSKLTGEAKEAISGLELSHENYDVALAIIQERFGDAQSVINKHSADGACRHRAAVLYEIEAFDEKSSTDGEKRWMKRPRYHDCPVAIKRLKIVKVKYNTTPAKADINDNFDEFDPRADIPKMCDQKIASFYASLLEICESKSKELELRYSPVDEKRRYWNAYIRIESSITWSTHIKKIRPLHPVQCNQERTLDLV